MTSDFESAFQHLLKTIVQEVVQELERKWLIPSRSPVPAIEKSDDGFLLRPREAAKRMGISERTLFKLTRFGNLPCVRIGHSVRYSIETIQKWIRETESTEPPLSKKIKAVSPRAHSAIAPAARPRPTSKPVTKRRPAIEKAMMNTSKQKQATIPPVRANEKKPETEDRHNPFSNLLNEIGVSRSQLPKITNGDLLRIAEVDMATFHGWMYLNREMPETALNKLRAHYCSYRNDDEK